MTVFKAYAFENRRRFGSMVVHLGVIVVALGVTGAGAYRIDEQVRVDFGSSTPFQSYTLKAIDRFMQQDPGQVIAGAVIEVWQNDRKLKTLRPSIKVFFHDGMTAQQPVPTPAIFYRFQHDIYLNVNGVVSPDQDFVVLRVVQSPMIVWIWLGGFIMALGTVYSLLPAPERKSQRSLGGVPA
ncbi:MAG: cytochrome c-type biogenesis CcmF C-terminal domain-containing protein [Deinococcales bacterium]